MSWGSKFNEIVKVKKLKVSETVSRWIDRMSDVWWNYFVAGLAAIRLSGVPPVQISRAGKVGLGYNSKVFTVGNRFLGSWYVSAGLSFVVCFPGLAFRPLVVMINISPFTPPPAHFHVIAILNKPQRWPKKTSLVLLGLQFTIGWNLRLEMLFHWRRTNQKGRLLVHFCEKCSPLVNVAYCRKRSTFVKVRCL